jgi:hypothetical protein
MQAAQQVHGIGKVAADVRPGLLEQEREMGVPQAS